LQPPQEQGPVINDLERIAYAAPPNVRFDIPPNFNAGLATPPQMVPKEDKETISTAPVGGIGGGSPDITVKQLTPKEIEEMMLGQTSTPSTPSLASPMSFATPSAVGVEPAASPAPVSQAKSKPVTSQDAGPKIEVPGMPGVYVGDRIEDGLGNVWDWEKGEWIMAKEPTVPETPKVEELTPEQVAETVGTQTPTTSTPTVTPGTNTPPPGTEIEKTPSDYVPARVILEPRTYDPIQITDFQFSEPAPTAPIVRQPGRLIPTLKPIDIELPMRRAIERLAPGIFKDINYDPELILEAAMRSLGPRYAKQSLLDEQRMFERMK
jgi:hypothetical protein